MKFVFLVIGRSKFPFVEEGLRHYLESIRHMAELEYVELKEAGSRKREEAGSFEEALKRRKLLDGRTRVFLLDERGKSFSSEEFAAHLGALRDQGVQRFAFVVGGAYGFPDELRSRFPLLSLSSMTFPHDLARLILAEQIYRALEPVSQPPRSPDSGYRKPSFGMNPVIPAPNSARRTSLLPRRRGFSALLATA